MGLLQDAFDSGQLSRLQNICHKLNRFTYKLLICTSRGEKKFEMQNIAIFQNINKKHLSISFLFLNVFISVLSNIRKTFIFWNWTCFGISYAIWKWHKICRNISSFKNKNVFGIFKSTFIICASALFLYQVL